VIGETGRARRDRKPFDWWKVVEWVVVVLTGISVALLVAWMSGL